MNQDQLEGKWDQLKGNVRENFGELTDDDVEQVKGKRENLIGKLKERYGDTKEQAEKKIDEFLSRF
ncbi:MAG: general stress protein CsbD [Salinisphaeraceae bacterium]|jgi:uncharacterized protein YjbJ (UPF0337 family)|nr:general stress protein CsbD [Salinisphaeraceae bacterium]